MPKSFYNGCENEQKPYENRKNQGCFMNDF